MLLLIKDDKTQEALESFIVLDKHKDAEDFCDKHSDNEKKLFTMLFKVYMKKYEEAKQDVINQAGDQDFASLKLTEERYQDLALGVLKKYATHSGLDQLEVLRVIPGEWKLNEVGGFSLIKFMKSVFDHKLTVQENCQISENLSSIEMVSNQTRLSKLKKAYVRLDADSKCGVCSQRIDHRKLFIYPNG